MGGEAMALPEQVMIDVLRSGLLAGAAEPIARLSSDRLIALLEVVWLARYHRTHDRELDAALRAWERGEG